MTLADHADACDAHFHIMDPRFPVVATASVPNVDAGVPAYREFATIIGTTRGVIVQPSIYGTDNTLTLQAVAQLGPGYRAVLVLDQAFDAADLPRWHAAGARGVRFNQVQAGATTMDMMPQIARRIAPFGWHVQLHMRADDLVQHEAVLGNLPVPLVLDHCGRLQPGDTQRPVFDGIRRLLAKGNTWIKLSGPYHVSRLGAPGYEDAVSTAQRLLAENDERMLWGSDWPHVTEPVRPDPQPLVRFVHSIAPTAARRQRILVDNPARLYGFGSPV